MKLLIGLLAIIGFFGISVLHWRRSIQIVFILLVIEGVLRKWVLPQASDLMYFLKDYFLLGAYINFCLVEKRFVFKISFINVLILLITGWCLFQIFNSSLGSPIVGLFGLRGYLLYIPLVWLLSPLFRTEESLYKFLRWHLLLTIPVGILGIAQFFSPASSPINVYTPSESIVATFGAVDAVRVTGTFSYISGYSAYLLISFGLLIPLLSKHQSFKWRLFSIVELAFVVINSFMTGSRGLLIAEGLCLLGYLSLKGVMQPGKILRLVKQLIPATLVAALVAIIWFQPAINAFWLRTSANQDLPSRLVGSFNEPLQAMQYKGLDGYGPGATHQAAPALRRALDLPKGEFVPIFSEGEISRVTLELGPIGFFLWYALRLSLIVLLLRTCWQLKGSFLKDLALAAALIQATQITGTLVFHHTFSVYYWFLSGFTVLLPQLERVNNWHQDNHLWRHHAQVYLPGPPHEQS